MRGTLLSAGFDWDIMAWDAERLEKIGTMTGHKAPVTAVSQVEYLIFRVSHVTKSNFMGGLTLIL